MKYVREIPLSEGERIDDLQRNGYGVIQKDDGFCFGMDAVLLSGFAEVKKSETAMDLGTGTGIIPILLCAKTAGQRFYGLEIQEDCAERAARSVLLNGLENKLTILRGDLRAVLGKEAEIRYPVAGGNSLSGQDAPVNGGETSAGGTCRCEILKKGSFDVVTANPPYMKLSGGLQNPDPGKRTARHELYCTLEEVCAAAAALLKSGGRFYLVHRPSRLTEIMESLLRYRLEPKRMKLVHPYLDREANMVLIEARKDAGKECRVEKPLIVYQSPGIYTKEIIDLYAY